VIIEQPFLMLASQMLGSWVPAFDVPWFLAAEANVLVDWIKPILMVLPFLPWGWLVTTKLEPDARYFHLNYHGWNAAHVAAAILAVVALLAIPIFWVGWPVSMLLLAAPILAYWKVRNGVVPEAQKFKLTGEGFAVKMAARKSAASARDAKVVYLDRSKKPLPVPSRDEPLFPVHILTEQMLEPAVAARATRLELSPAQGGYLVSQFIDGVRYKREMLQPNEANAAIDYLKRAAGLDLEDRRRRQVGQFRMKSTLGETIVDIATSGAAAGQSLRVDFDRTKRVNRPFDSLGLLQPQIEILKPLLEQADRHGVVLVGAPSGHGLTTTAYSLLGRHDAFTTNIKTLERLIELHLDGIDHTQFDASNPAADFATSLQSILRRDPDIVLIGDLKEPNTGKTAASPGINGPLLYIPQQLDSVAAQFADWARAVGDGKKAAAPLRAIMNQRLLRVVCPQCRQPYQPAADLAKRLGLAANKQHALYRAGGKVQVKNRVEDCPVCNGVGYFGQIAVFEVMGIDDECRKLLAAGDFKGAYAVARRNKMLYLQEAALAKVRDGQTTVEEIARVLNPPKSDTPAAVAARA